MAQLTATVLQPRLPFWPLLFKNATIRLVGSDDLPEEAEHRVAADITACLKEGLLRPRVGARYRSRGSPRPTRRWRAAAPGAAWSSTSARGRPRKGPRSSW